MLHSTSSVNLQVLYRQMMRRKTKAKVSQKAKGMADNIIAAIVYVIVTSLVLSELYRFVQKTISR